VPLLEADETAAALWARHLEAAGIKNSTAARKLTAVSSFYGWCARCGHVRANPAAGLPRPAVDYDTSATPGLTRDQAIALLEAADAGPQAARTAALAATLLYTGARVSELLGADIEDLGTDRGHRVLRVRCKGGKIQALALPAPAADRIDAYLATRDDVTALPAVPGGTAAAGPVRHRHRGADVPSRGPRPAAPPRPRRRPGREPVPALHAARFRHAVWTPTPACATYRTPWATPPPVPPAATTAAAATWTAPPATCSPGTSAAPDEPGPHPPVHAVVGAAAHAVTCAFTGSSGSSSCPKPWPTPPETTCCC
jgi:integrase